MELHVWTPGDSPRLRYIFDFFFRQIASLPYRIFTDKEQFMGATGGWKFSYGEQIGTQTPFQSAHSLLWEEGLNPGFINIQDKNIEQLFSTAQDEGVFDFDVFAAAFFLLSRYEEYSASQRDVHDRYLPENSILYKSGGIEEPVVDQWVYALIDRLRQTYPDLPVPRRRFSFLPTVDIDNAYAFRGKGRLRTTAAVARDFLSGNAYFAKKRLRVRMGREHDPYDNYGQICQIHSEYGFKPVFFIQVSKYGGYDKNISPRRKLFRQLIRHLNASYLTGLHPGYTTWDRPDKLLKEKKRLEAVLHSPVFVSRQHYLRFAVPHTFRALLDAGIEADFSMGYPDRPGFRAGTATPFRFFDLEAGKVTGLWLFPLHVMDASLKYYYKLRAADAWPKVEKIMDAAREINGMFITLWHNEAFMDTGIWKNWNSLYRKMLDKARSFQDDQ